MALAVGADWIGKFLLSFVYYGCFDNHYFTLMIKVDVNTNMVLIDQVQVRPDIPLGKIRGSVLSVDQLEA